MWAALERNMTIRPAMKNRLAPRSDREESKKANQSRNAMAPTCRSR